MHRPVVSPILVLCLVALWTLVPDAATPKKGKKKRQAKTAEELQVVDCLLPGQVRRLGRRSQFLTARRPVRTTAVDCEIRGGEYTAHDRASYATALAIWLPAAEAGDAKAQTYIGEVFEKGLASTPDYGAAATWYRKAAEHGHTRAQINLGHLYEKGLGVEIDPAVALEWYRRAAGLEEAVVLDWTQQEATLRQETETLRGELEATRGELDKALSALDSAQSETGELRRQLQAAKKSQASEASVRSDLESRLQKSEARVDEIRQAIRDYRGRLAQLKAREDTGTAVAGPTITLIEPDVLATRGPSLLVVPGGLSKIELTGRVTAPAGLRQLRVDGHDQQVDGSGFFRLELPSTPRRSVILEAFDARGQKARKELILQSGTGDSTGDSISPPPPPPPRPRRPSPNLHALILSVASYDHLPDLKTVRADTTAVERVLAERYGFNTTVLEDPSQFEILSALADLAPGLEEKDSLLIYYAGHGQVRGDQGYWIGADGAEDHPTAWVSNQAVSDQLDVLRAGRVLVVSDSCYSGTLTRSGVARSDAGSREPIAGRRSRTVLTSGGLQPVLDEGGGDFSIFAQAFIRVLELNTESLSGTELHREVSARVRFAARALGVRQQPDYAPIQYAGHEAGDFVLLPSF